MPRELGAPIHVVVADPQPDEPRALLDSQPGVKVVGEARDLPETLRQVRLSDPDVLLLDLVTPGGDGVALIRVLRDERPWVRVLVVTLLDAPADLRAVLAAGGRGYLLKPASEQELLEAIRAVFRGGTFVKVTPDAQAVSEAPHPARPCLH